MVTLLSSAAQAWDKLAGQSAGIKDAQTVVVRTQKEWAALWTRHTAGRSEAMPQVDFSKEMVVGVFLGERNTGGYKVETKLMADPIEPKSRLVVFYKEVPPAAGRFNVQMVTRPFELRKVAKVQEVVFEADRAVTIPENQNYKKSAFTPENTFRIQETVSRLQALSEAPQALFDR